MPARRLPRAKTICFRRIRRRKIWCNKAVSSVIDSPRDTRLSYAAGPPWRNNPAVLRTRRQQGPLKRSLKDYFTTIVGASFGASTQLQRRQQLPSPHLREHSRLVRALKPRPARPHKARAPAATLCLFSCASFIAQYDVYYDFQYI